MVAYAVAVMTGSPWLGVLAAGVAGACFGLFHGWICKFPKVNDIAIGIAMMLFGTGLAFFFGKPFIQPSAPHLPAIPFGGWSDIPQVQAALDVNPLFLVGAALAVVAVVGLPQHPVGLIVRMAGDSADAARAMGVIPTGALPRHRPPAARWPASAARSCRSTIPAAGTRASRPARA